ncbi:hypothetical protein TA3x_001567 [Tundrisphaera sp. TA3]|uniref:hypothetical protein n=1 Tax=Tundrisphaera sp. TA3 TaxID=3435775 RepID=UPI003EB86A3E
MSVLKRYDPPANISDLTDPAQDELLRAEWSSNVNRWTETAILGDPWSSLNDQNRSFYDNPLQTDLAGGSAKLISWFAFPNRILVNFANASFLDQMGFAEGVHNDGTFGPPPPVNGRPYGPAGPRGWQDEYCEWIARRNSQGKITQVDFTCENPEYWYTLWRFDPKVVLDLYQELVGPQVQLEDLYLTDGTGAPIIDRSTGLPAYNITNRWNNQPTAGQVTGAVHLISPPNTLGAEIYLAAAATLLRDNPPGTAVTSEGDLIACSQYGQAGRNSDPHIGATVNGVIRGGGQVISLENPIGLYIQMPDFSTYQLPPDPKLPAGAQPSDCWQIIRGVESLPGLGGNFILHARFALPQAWIAAGVQFTVGDITIGGNPIQLGAQITQTFQIALRGFALATTKTAEAPQPCVAVNPNPLPAPQQLQDLNLAQAGSTSTVPPKVAVGSTTPQVALFASNAKQGATVTFPEGGVTARVDQFQDQGQGASLLVLTLSVDSNAAPGDRSLLLTNPDGTAGPAAPGMLTVVPAASSVIQQAPAATARFANPRDPKELGEIRINIRKSRS